MQFQAFALLPLYANVAARDVLYSCCLKVLLWFELAQVLVSWDGCVGVLRESELLRRMHYAESPTLGLELTRGWRMWLCGGRGGCVRSGMRVGFGLVRVVDGLLMAACPQRAQMVLSLGPPVDVRRLEMALSA